MFTHLHLYTCKNLSTTFLTESRLPVGPVADSNSCSYFWTRIPLVTLSRIGYKLPLSIRRVSVLGILVGCERLLQNIEQDQDKDKLHSTLKLRGREVMWRKLKREAVGPDCSPISIDRTIVGCRGSRSTLNQLKIGTGKYWGTQLVDSANEWFWQKLLSSGNVLFTTCTANASLFFHC